MGKLNIRFGIHGYLRGLGEEHHEADFRPEEKVKIFAFFVVSHS